MLTIHGYASLKRLIPSLVIAAGLFMVSPLELQAAPSGGGAINTTTAVYDSGYSYIVRQDFGITADRSLVSSSTLRVFENGIELGPAHTWHSQIRSLGMGRFSHWGGSDGTSSPSALYFSASDNTDPRQNGRMYTYRTDSQAVPPPPTPTPSPAVTPPPTPTRSFSPPPAASSPSPAASIPTARC